MDYYSFGKDGDDMKINTKEMQEEVRHLTAILEEYKEVKLNLFNKLEEATSVWQDGISPSFEEKIYVEKQNTAYLVQQVEAIEKTYQTVYEQYNCIGSNIECNLDARQILLDKTNYFLGELKNIASLFNRIDTSFFYVEKELILKQKEKIELQIKQLEYLKVAMTNFFNRLEKIEKTTGTQLGKIHENTVTEFELIID